MLAFTWGVTLASFSFIAGVPCAPSPRSGQSARRLIVRRGPPTAQAVTDIFKKKLLSIGLQPGAASSALPARAPPWLRRGLLPPLSAAASAQWR